MGVGTFYSGAAVAVAVDQAGATGGLVREVAVFNQQITLIAESVVKAGVLMGGFVTQVVGSVARTVGPEQGVD